MTGQYKVEVAAKLEGVEAAAAALEARAEALGIAAVTAFEEDGNTGRWALSAYFDEPPSPSTVQVMEELAGSSPKVTYLAPQDWTAVGARRDPVRAGRFLVTGPDSSPPLSGEAVALRIPAAQAFGTGHHETTAGCLAVLDQMRRSGVRASSIADVGTGTGLLAFGGRALWPSARVTASDSDPLALEAVVRNAALNSVPVGAARGAVLPILAAGLDHPLLEARQPFDLLIANILAGPLIELAPDFRSGVSPGGNVILAGLLERQEPAVRRAYRKQGFRLARRLVKGDWSILWLRRRSRL
jgi:ribosomal protein L11 methyltransferase